MESMEEAGRGPTLSERGRLTPINHKILAQMRRANKQLAESKKKWRWAIPMIAVPGRDESSASTEGGSTALLTRRRGVS